MSGYPDNSFDGAAQPTATDAMIQTARAKVALPATFLMLNGLAGIIIWGALTGVWMSNPLLPIETLRQAITQQPDSPDKKEALDKLQQSEDEIKANPDEAKSKILRNGAIVCGTNSLAILGAVLLRVWNNRMWGYGSATISMIPMVTGLCCTGMPFGLWMLIVLLNPETTAGLDAARARAKAPPSDGY